MSYKETDMHENPENLVRQGNLPTIPKVPPPPPPRAQQQGAVEQFVPAGPITKEYESE